ncbi:glycoside hydrolase family 43 protein [Paenibacillus lemnae]|uniref:Glycoside hydrolase family 43 protein n=1 Tax=Paenibacillus lemnae TaxID=1330551 RepID=A0A848M8F6_PAELE|nr:glycoside hydrolase family 43 protein [Paenibacillus lemnae]NMO97327.1 glycoside hydrolase family 43 protein [Paenibacillus lemnae]
MQQKPKYAGYLFAHFKGEEYEDGEQVYFALSQGNDPLNWQTLHGGKPVLVSDLGEKGIRDPYIVRSPDGGRFYMVATDLRIYGNGDWERAVTSGSRSIMVWESQNLIDWSGPDMVEIAPSGAGCAWAPEVFYDEETQDYKVFWASMMNTGLQDEDSSRYHRMMYVSTKDFRTFSEPEVYMDYGYSVIDTTMIQEKGGIYRFSKAEHVKHVIQEKGMSFHDSNFKMLNDHVETPFMARGEGPIIFKSNTEEKWILFIDEYGLRGYIPLETDDLDSGSWRLPEQYSLPGTLRHGSVIPVTTEEYDRLLEYYGGGEENGI